MCHSRNSLPPIRSQGKFAVEHTRFLAAHATLHLLAECAILAIGIVSYAVTDYIYNSLLAVYRPTKESRLLTSFWEKPF